ncbi:hypothetical protein [uncultured Hymenobacter sp.]|uniref:hypothetical protein n=1 Tax=uncultured Hymenobacter sp. TaxID=170016 RepID=UPI0035CB9349
MEHTSPIRTVRQELIPLSARAAWEEALQNIPHAFGHTWENCYAMQLTTGYATYLYLLQSGDLRIVCPLAERKYQGYTDIVTPYGFSGFAGTKDFSDFPDYWRRFISQAGYVCGYIGLNPLLVDETYLSATDIYHYNSVYVLNLQLSSAELYQRLSQNRKRQLRGWEGEAHRVITEKKELKKFFIAQYHTFITRKNAAPVYNFSLPTLLYLLDLEQVMLVGFQEAGEIKAVSVFASTSTIADYFFNVSLPGYQNQTAFLFWHGMLQLKSKGISYLNLGGGATADDSIAHFKQRFGAATLPLICLKQVYNEVLYADLCREEQVDPLNKEGYFPPYRRGDRAL